jgi:hypothetical protein
MNHQHSNIKPPKNFNKTLKSHLIKVSNKAAIRNHSRKETTTTRVSKENLSTKRAAIRISIKRSNKVALKAARKEVLSIRRGDSITGKTREIAISRDKRSEMNEDSIQPTLINFISLIYYVTDNSRLI